MAASTICYHYFLAEHLIIVKNYVNQLEFFKLIIYYTNIDIIKKIQKITFPPCSVPFKAVIHFLVFEYANHKEKKILINYKWLKHGALLVLKGSRVGACFFWFFVEDLWVGALCAVFLISSLIGHWWRFPLYCGLPRKHEKNNVDSIVLSFVSFFNSQYRKILI